MNIGQFNARVSGAIKRGSSLDAIIPFWVAEAARVLEQNYTFSWMEKTQDFVTTVAPSQLTIPMPVLLKSVEWVKPAWSTDGGYVNYGDPLTGVDSRDVTAISGSPSGYWIEGTDGSYVIKFDSVRGQDYTWHVKHNLFTDWPDDDAAVPALLARGQLALFAQTLILFANEQKDARMVDQYGGILQGALNTLLRSDEELKLAHQNDLRVMYSGLD